MTSSRSPFFWFISTALAALAIGMNYFGFQLPLGNLLLAGGGPFDIMLIAYIVLWVSGVVAGS